MIKLEIIFIGLIAFAPAEDGVLAVLTEQDERQPDHVAKIYQIDGTCEPEEYCGYLTEETWTHLRERHDGLPEQRPDLSGDKLKWFPRQTHVTWTRDCTNCSLDDLKQSWKNLKQWIPSVEYMVPGWARLRRSCRKKCQHCPIETRVHIPAGELSVCHYIHHPRHPDWVALYSVRSKETPIGNAVSLTVEVPADTLSITASSFDGSPLVTAELSPYGGRITLVVQNEPTVNGDPPGVPDRLEHFTAHYTLLDPVWNLPGRLSDYAPEFLGWFALGKRSVCENLLERAAEVDKELLLDLAALKTAPHGPSECDVATVP